MIRGWRRWRQEVRDRKAAAQRTTFVYCPECRFDLNGAYSEAFLADTEAGVQYRCPKCATWSRWLFDAPTPICLEWVTPAGRFVGRAGSQRTVFPA